MPAVRICFWGIGGRKESEKVLVCASPERGGKLDVDLMLCISLADS